MLVDQPATPHVPTTVFHRRFGALADEDDRARVERVISFARLLVSAIALLAIWLDPTEPARYASLTYALAGTYTVASLAALVWLRRRSSGSDVHWCCQPPPRAR